MVAAYFSGKIDLIQASAPKCLHQKESIMSVMY